MKIDLTTLALQAVNVLVLLWLLHRLLYKPVQAVLAQRQALTTQRLDEARQAQAAADAERTALSNERRRLAETREQALAQAAAAVAEERARRIAEADAEAAERANIARAALATERAAAETALTDAAAALAVQLANQLLTRLPAAAGPALDLAYVDEAAAELRGFGATSALTIASAHPLDAAMQAALRAKIDADVELHFVVEPALIAGVELRLAHGVIRRHWTQDLADAAELLRRDANAH